MKRKEVVTAHEISVNLIMVNEELPEDYPAASATPICPRGAVTT